MNANFYLENAVTSIDGPLITLQREVEVGLYEAVEVTGDDGQIRLGRVASLSEDFMIVEVLDATDGLRLPQTRVRLLGKPLSFTVGPGLLGRVFDGVGRLIDGGPPIQSKHRLPISGMPINPAARAVPSNFIETGITSIDLLNSLIRGQKLPVFSAGGLPHDRMAIEIAQHARLESEEALAIVFVGIGISHDSAEAFRLAMEQSGSLEHTVLFLNLASDSSTQRLLTPRFALTAAEYLAFIENKHVLVVMTDMTNYCEAMREVSSSHGEIPSRKAYPGYMYSDLASIYERAGCLKNGKGSLTQLPILTMPSDDISHPIPDLTGYITEGQIVLDRELELKGVYPPVKVLPSLSRLMKDGIGAEYTHPDHPALAQQLYAAYARGVRMRVMASVVGSEGLPENDKKFLQFAEQFEQQLIQQSSARSLSASMKTGWRLLASLPLAELSQLSDQQIQQYLENASYE